MTHGLEIEFLLAVEISDHPLHRQANGLLDRLLDEGHDLALAPQTLAEFIYLVTDAGRWSQPLDTAEAVRRAEHWWQAREVVHVLPGEHAVTDFFDWLREHRLGRDQLLETMLAASFRDAGIKRIISSDGSGFRVIG